MSLTQANVRSFQALIDFGRSLSLFREETHQALDAINKEIRRIDEWLVERRRYWQHQKEYAKEMILQARRAMERCIESARDVSDKRDERYRSDCSEYEEELSEAYRYLRHSEEELQNIIHWHHMVENAVNDYYRQASRLNHQLDNDVTKGEAFLKQKILQLESYKAETARGRSEMISGISANIRQDLMNSVMSDFPCSYLGSNVELTHERELHIAKGHPDLLPAHKQCIADTLADPDQVRRSTHDDNARSFTRWFDSLRGGKYVVVVVVSDSDYSPKQQRHWIITAYITRKLTKGEIEWERI